MPVAARFGQRHDEGGWDGFLIGDDLCWSASDLTAAAECEYAVLRQLDYVLKRESRLDIPEDRPIAEGGSPCAPPKRGLRFRLRHWLQQPQHQGGAGPSAGPEREAVRRP